MQEDDVVVVCVPKILGQLLIVIILRASIY
jgi:hypothetical protein